MAVKAYSISIFAVLFFSFTAIYAQVNDFSLKELAGVYNAGRELNANEIDLDANGNYKRNSNDFDINSTELGLVTLDYGLLHFNFIKSIAKSTTDDKELDTLHKNDNPLVEGYRTTFKLIPIKWSSRIYLIPSVKACIFLQAVNLGIEPRNSKISRYYLGDFYVRDTRRENSEAEGLLSSISGLPEISGLPNCNIDLLETPITAKILKIEINTNGMTAEINKGSKDGLKVGMPLFTINKHILMASADILSVTSQSSKVKLYEKLRVGDQISTQFIQRDRYLPY